jgi:outer membrane immunogenic protein
MWPNGDSLGRPSCCNLSNILFFNGNLLQGHWMRKLLGVSLLSLVVAIPLSAFAADMPVKAPVAPPAPVVSWTGFYAGVNAGYGWSERSTINTIADPTFLNPIFPVGAGAEATGLTSAASTQQVAKGNSFLGGGQIGYNYQFSPQWVAGIEADIDGLTNGAAFSTQVRTVVLPAFTAETYTGNVTVSRTLDYIGTVRARLGYVPTPNLLLYGTGGFAYGGVHTFTSYSFQETIASGGLPAVLSTAGSSSTRTGWAAGAGGEWMVTPNWTVRLEYLHYDLGSVTDNTTLTQLNTVTVPGSTIVYHTSAAQTFSSFAGDIVRVGVNYKFSWAGR